MASVCLPNESVERTMKYSRIPKKRCIPPRRKKFSSYEIDGLRLPHIYRDDAEYILVSVVNEFLLSRFPKCHLKQLRDCPGLQTEYITGEEANMLNRIERNLYGDFGGPFLPGDLIVELHSAIKYYELVRDAFMHPSKEFAPLEFSNCSEDCTVSSLSSTDVDVFPNGWILMKKTVVPCIRRVQRSPHFVSSKLVPLQIVEQALGYQKFSMIISSSGLERYILDSMCLNAGHKFRFPDDIKLIMLHEILEKDDQIPMFRLPDQLPFLFALYFVNGYDIQPNIKDFLSADSTNNNTLPSGGHKHGENNICRNVPEDLDKRPVMSVECPPLKSIPSGEEENLTTVQHVEKVHDRSDSPTNEILNLSQHHRYLTDKPDEDRGIPNKSVLDAASGTESSEILTTDIHTIYREEEAECIDLTVRKLHQHVRKASPTVSNDTEHKSEQSHIWSNTEDVCKANNAGNAKTVISESPNHCTQTLPDQPPPLVPRNTVIPTFSPTTQLTTSKNMYQNENLCVFKIPTKEMIPQKPNGTIRHSLIKDGHIKGWARRQMKKDASKLSLNISPNDSENPQYVKMPDGSVQKINLRLLNKVLDQTTKKKLKRLIHSRQANSIKPGQLMEKSASPCSSQQTVIHDAEKIKRNANTDLQVRTHPKVASRPPTIGEVVEEINRPLGLYKRPCPFIGANSLPKLARLLPPHQSNSHSSKTKGDIVEKKGIISASRIADENLLPVTPTCHNPSPIIANLSNSRLPTTIPQDTPQTDKQCSGKSSDIPAFESLLEPEVPAKTSTAEADENPKNAKCSTPVMDTAGDVCLTPVTTTLIPSSRDEINIEEQPEIACTRESRVLYVNNQTCLTPVKNSKHLLPTNPSPQVVLSDILVHSSFCDKNDVKQDVAIFKNTSSVTNPHQRKKVTPHSLPEKKPKPLMQSGVVSLSCH